MNWKYTEHHSPTRIRSLEMAKELAANQSKWNAQKQIRARYGFIPGYPGQRRQSYWAQFNATPTSSANALGGR